MIRHHWLRRIFTGILLFTLFMIVSCQTGATRNTEQTTTISQNSKQATSRPTIVYGELVIKAESDYILIPVRLSRDKNQARTSLLESSSYERQDLFSNLIFYRKQDGETHLLLNKKSVLSSFDFLEKKEQGKNQIRYWLYKIIEDDTNTDKKLTQEDATIGYLSDLSGKNLQQITPNNTQLMSWTVVQSMGAILAKIIKDSDNDKKFTERDETAFIKINLDNPTIGTEIINEQIKQQIQSIGLE